MKKHFLKFDAKLACEFIKPFESFRAESYVCPAGILTIGYGHTGSDVMRGLVITKDEAEELLLSDVSRIIRQIAPAIKVPVTEGQFIALTSLAFNVGAWYLKNKCPKLMTNLNDGNFEGCAKEFLDITTAKGVVLTGLVVRRKREADLFLGK